MSVSSLRRTAPLGSVLLVSLVSIVLGSGCASFLIVDPSAPNTLGWNEGFVIIHIETDVELETIGSDTIEFAANVPVGESAWIVRTRAGSYSWNSFEVLDRSGFRCRRMVATCVLHPMQTTWSLVTPMEPPISLSMMF